MTPLNTKVLLQLGMTVVAAITNEVLEHHRAAKRDAQRPMEKRHDRPS